MRVPVVKSDLPLKFNKLAKYIGRHWPEGKLSLNHSRESVAVLLGYNSVNEVSKVADNTVLPASIEMDKVYRSIASKALIHFGIRPDSLFPVLHRAPFKEMAFYRHSDVEKERLAAETFLKTYGYSYYPDEMSYFGDKSPELLLDLHKQQAIPPYEYAVNQEGLIFCAATFEAVLNKIGSIEEVMADTETTLSQEQFIQRYILPQAWMPVNKYLARSIQPGRARWLTPVLVNVYVARIKGTPVGYMLKHDGYDAYYPVLCSTAEQVLAVLELIFMNAKVEPQQLPEGEILLSASFGRDHDLSSSSATTYGEVVLFDHRHLIIDGQPFIRDTRSPLLPYDELQSDPVLKSSLVLKNVELVTTISVDVLNPELHKTHKALPDAMSHAATEMITFLNSTSSDRISDVLSTALGSQFTSIHDILVNDDTELDDEDRDNWRTHGEHAGRQHAELLKFADHEALGYWYMGFEGDIAFNRYPSFCSDRNLAFIAYVLSHSPLFTRSWYSTADNVNAALLVLGYFCKHPAELSVDSLTTSFNAITAMMIRFKAQSKAISAMEYWDNHQKHGLDSQFISNGKKVSYREKSSAESLQELFELARSAPVTLKR